MTYFFLFLNDLKIPIFDLKVNVVIKFRDSRIFKLYLYIRSQLIKLQHQKHSYTIKPVPQPVRCPFEQSGQPNLAQQLGMKLLLHPVRCKIQKCARWMGLILANGHLMQCGIQSKRDVI